ncbi:MAG: TolC family protein [Alphaproteobacteria bacterium]|nr:TolC family protein [Alphaproteobacteria bacterium]
MLKYKFVFLCICSMLFSVSANALDPFSIYDDKAAAVCEEQSMEGKIDLAVVMEKAICANIGLKTSYLSALVSGASYGQGLSSYLPTVSLSESIETTSRKVDGGSHSETGSVGAWARLNWLLLDFGGRSANVERLKAALQSSYFAYDDTLQTLLYTVAENYYGVLSAEEKYEGLMEAEKSAKKAFEEASSRYDLGLVPLSDKLQAQTSYEQAKLASNVARKNIALERGNLAHLLDMPPYTMFDLKRPDKELKNLPKIEEIKDLIEKALAQRPDYKAVQQDLLAAEHQIDVAKSDGLPSLSGNLSAGADKDIRDGNRAVYSGTAGLTITMPFFTGFSQSYKIGQAKLQYQAAQENLKKAKSSIENEVWNAIQDYETSLESFKISQTLLDSAKETEKVAFASYKVGKVNILTLLDAQSALASARVENSTSFYNFLTAQNKLQKALGQMEKIK